MQTREYQDKAVQAVLAHWAHGTKSVCLIGPTGCGKTHMGRMALEGAERVLWASHRRDLVLQTAERLTDVFGRRSVGVIAGGEYETPQAPVQVATIQSYLARVDGRSWEPTHIVLDEAHHYMADEWRAVLARHPEALTLGLTATPQRGDGRGLCDIFGAAVVAANYSELIAAGFLVGAKVWRPEKRLGSDLAQDPVVAYMAHGERGQAFVFCARIALAQAACRRFVKAGIAARVIDATTPKTKRDRILDDFRRGRVRVVVNVGTMTEGIDVPEASVCVLARNFDYVGGMMQVTGRVLRACRDKAYAIVIDLNGSTLRHGLPTMDRHYSLDGKPISGGEAVEREAGERGEFAQEIVDAELQMVSDGVEVAEQKPQGVTRTRTRSKLPTAKEVAMSGIS